MANSTLESATQAYEVEYKTSDSLEMQLPDMNLELHEARAVTLYLHSSQNNTSHHCGLRVTIKASNDK